MRMKRRGPIEPLRDEDYLWLARRILQLGADRAAHPSWTKRIDGSIDELIWSASVDGRQGDEVVKDGWAPPGQRLREPHLQRLAHTERASLALQNGKLKEITRDHIVPRAYLKAILLGLSDAHVVASLLRRYARIALVHSEEHGRLPRDAMPEGWGVSVDWRRPDGLPCEWDRYRPVVAVVLPGGVPAF